MLAIPLPFVVSLLLCVLAGSLWVQRQSEAKTACYFLFMCAMTTTIVGLRWTFDSAILRCLQPIFASLIPVFAWRVFACANQQATFSTLHWIAPGLVTLGSLTYPYWSPPLDMMITLLYIGYGVALLRASLKQNRLPLNVRFSAVSWALKAEKLAGGMLLFSALIDGTLTLDFDLFDGQHTMLILSIGHAILLPTLSLSVVFLSLSTPIDESAPALQQGEQALQDEKEAGMSSQEANEIAKKVTALLQEQGLFLDQDLTLARLARKAGIPSRQISYAINQTYGRNISQIVNQYRIEKAQTLLKTTDQPITQVYLNAGFQTKSNFNREFSRLTGVTPTVYRREARELGHTEAM